MAQPGSNWPTITRHFVRYPEKLPGAFYDGLELTAIPSEMLLAESHLQLRIVTVNFEHSRYGNVMLYVQFDGLRTPERSVHHFTARVYRVSQSAVDGRLDYSLEGRNCDVTGVLDYTEGGGGTINIPSDLERRLPELREGYASLGDFDMVFHADAVATRGVLI